MVVFPDYLWIDLIQNYLQPMTAIRLAATCSKLRKLILVKMNFFWYYHQLKLQGKLPTKVFIHQKSMDLEICFQVICDDQVIGDGVSSGKILNNLLVRLQKDIPKFQVDNFPLIYFPVDNPWHPLHPVLLNGYCYNSECWTRIYYPIGHPIYVCSDQNYYDQYIHHLFNSQSTRLKAIPSFEKIMANNPELKTAYCRAALNILNQS